MKRTHRLTAGILCVILAALLAVPASAHGCHGEARGHHRRYVQTCVAVCPYEDCTETGRHTHDGETYCGYAHAGAFCDGSCVVSGCRRWG